MGQDQFETLCEAMGKAKVINLFFDKLTKEMKEEFTFEDWQNAYIRNHDFSPAHDKIREECFEGMEKTAESANEWMVIYVFAAEDSEEEKRALQKLEQDESITYEKWAQIYSDASSRHNAQVRKKIQTLAERRIRELLDQN